MLEYTRVGQRRNPSQKRIMTMVPLATTVLVVIALVKWDP
jgi:hypothetical protein